MKINIGSINTVKVGAVSEIIQDYPHLSDAVLRELQTDSGVSVQPKSLEETIQGAMNRAKNVFDDCGKEFHIGLSSAWEFPDKKITELMIKEGLDMSEAINRAGLTDNPQIGSEEGAIGILTKGRLTRKDYTKQALRTALIHLEQFDF